MTWKDKILNFAWGDLIDMVWMMLTMLLGVMLIVFEDDTALSAIGFMLIGLAVIWLRIVRWQDDNQEALDLVYDFYNKVSEMAEDDEQLVITIDVVNKPLNTEQG